MAPLLGSHSVFLEMEFAATTTTVWLNWMRCQSFRTSIDQLTGSHSNSPGKYDGDCGSPKDSWSSTGDSWRKKDCESMESHPAKVRQKCSPLRPCGTASGFSGSCGSTWIQDLCIFFWGVHCNVNFGMVEFAPLSVWLHWMRCQSFRTSIDQMTGLHCNSPGKYDRDCGFLEDPWYSIGDSWRKGGCQSTQRHPAKVCQKSCYRLVSLWFWWAATQAWWTFETSWKYCTFMFAVGAAQIDPESTAGHAICDNSLGHHQNCLHNVRKLPYDHLLPGIPVTA